MTGRPIIFSAPMVRALLDGRKTQTRRILKPQPAKWEPRVIDITTPFFNEEEGGWGQVETIWSGPLVSGYCEPEREVWRPLKLPYAVGDRLVPAMRIPSLTRSYCADVYGFIWSRARDGETWEKLRGSPTSKGYLSVTPAREGKYQTRLIHRLVAEAFYGFEPDGLRQVRHLNGNQSDNAPDNLDWGSHEDNWSDRYAHGRGSGEAHHAARLSNSDVEAIRSSKKPQRVLAAEYSVAQSTIWAVRKGVTWVDSPQPNPTNCARWASRITLEVTEVRVQRLQEISYVDAEQEGVQCDMSPRTFIDHFRNLWNRIHGPDAWAANPWVAAVTFKRVTP